MAKIKSSKHSTRKDVIIEQAAILFREKGYAASSMRDLAEKVGVEAASLYNHISSKAEILQDICFTVATEFMTFIAQVELKNTSSLEKVEEILRFHIRHMIEKYETVYVMDREWKHLNEPYLPNFQNQRRSYRQRFAAVIEEGIRNGEIKNIDAPTAVLIMLHAVSGIESWHRSKRKIPADQLEENMVLMLVGGLKK